MQFPVGCAPSFAWECLVSLPPPISLYHTHTSMAVLSSPLLAGDGIQLGKALHKLYMTQSNDF